MERGKENETKGMGKVEVEVEIRDAIPNGDDRFCFACGNEVIDVYQQGIRRDYLRGIVMVLTHKLRGHQAVSPWHVFRAPSSQNISVSQLSPTRFNTINISGVTS